MESSPTIDAPGHYGDYVRNEVDPLVNSFSSASVKAVAERARNAGISWTIVSPLSGLFPRNQADAVTGNRSAWDEVPRTPGLLQYVIVNPLQPETFAQAREKLCAPWCVGIKIHPEEHGYRIAELGSKLFSFLKKCALR